MRRGIDGKANRLVLMYLRVFPDFACAYHADASRPKLFAIYEFVWGIGCPCFSKFEVAHIPISSLLREIEMTPKFSMGD